MESEDKYFQREKWYKTWILCLKIQRISKAQKTNSKIS